MAVVRAVLETSSSSVVTGELRHRSAYLEMLAIFDFQLSIYTRRSLVSTVLRAETRLLLPRPVTDLRGSDHESKFLNNNHVARRRAGGRAHYFRSAI